MRSHIERRLREMSENTAAAFRATSEFHYERLMDPVINDHQSALYCRAAAARISGEANLREFEPMMGGEDFGGYLRVRPGAFVALGQGEPDKSSPHNCGLHSRRYDFNDAIIPIAASYFAELAAQRLPVHS